MHRQHITPFFPSPNHLPTSQFPSIPQSQVADLDDEFAELLLTEYSDNADDIPSSKVRMKWCHVNLIYGTVQFPTVNIFNVHTDTGGRAADHSGA